MKLVRAREELGALVLLPSEEVVRRVGDKFTAHLFFEERGIPSPPSWLPDDVPADARYPLLVKVREGFGSRNIFRARDRAELDFFLGYTAVDSFVQTCCKGEEFSIDVFCDLDGRCLNAIPRTMIQSKGGESIKGMTIQDRDLIEFGAEVAEALGLVGPGNDPVLPRGRRAPRGHRCEPALRRGVPVTARRGESLPGARAAARERERPEPRLGDFRAGVLMTRFFSHLCLTTDDGGTLVPFAEELPEPVAGEPGDA